MRVYFFAGDADDEEERRVTTIDTLVVTILQKRTLHTHAYS